MSELISTPAQAIERAAQIADAWAVENKAAAASARKHGDHHSMADRLDGAAIECNAIAAEIRKLADLIGPAPRAGWREPTLDERPY